jgi:hypothetical protein
MEDLESSKIFRIVHSEDYQFIKAKLTSLMAALDSINTLPQGLSNEQMGEEAKVRLKAQSLVKSWFDVLESESESFEQVQKLKETPKFIVNYETD